MSLHTNWSTTKNGSLKAATNHRKSSTQENLPFKAVSSRLSELGEVLPRINSAQENFYCGTHDAGGSHALAFDDRKGQFAPNI